MSILRFTFIIVIFLIVFGLCPPIEAAKHIIVVYDVSGSMVNSRTRRIMESEDIRRVNNYIADLLFDDTAQLLRNTARDSYIKECAAAYVGKPLYQSGDILTYATYTDRRNETITRKQVGRNEFYRQLPTNFPGQVSYLDRAKVEVYDELYLDTDDETYWVFVTDGDIDHSEERDPQTRDILRRLVEIEEEFHSPMIFGLRVKDRVQIEVRRIQKRIEDDKVFIANRTARNETVKEIQFLKDDAGQLISETLTIDTKNPDKTKFKLNSINVDIFDKYGKQINIVPVVSVPLHGHLPPYEFQIPLPANPEIAAPDNALKLKVIYNYNTKEKTYSMPLTDYDPVIKSIFVSDQENPNQLEQPLALRFSEDRYLATLVVQSENPTKTDFQIDNIRCQIQYKDKRKLCDVNIATTPQKLDEPFQITVSRVKDLDWYGNKLVLDVDYRYKDTVESETFEFAFELHGGNRGYLMGMLIILGVVVLLAIVVFAIRLVRKMLSPPRITYKIMLKEINRDDGHFFTLTNGETLSFRSRDDSGLHFDIGSPAVLRCHHGEFLLCDNANDDKGRKLTSGEILTLTRDDGDEVHIYFEIVDDDPQPPDEDNLLPD